MNNNLSISTTFTADGGSITKTTRRLAGGTVTYVAVFGRDGAVHHREFRVITPTLRGVVHGDLSGAERMTSAKGHELRETPDRLAALVALVREARLAV